jgi:hypothetical protein
MRRIVLMATMAVLVALSLLVSTGFASAKPKDTSSVRANRSRRRSKPPIRATPSWFWGASTMGPW